MVEFRKTNGLVYFTICQRVPILGLVYISLRIYFGNLCYKSSIVKFIRHLEIFESLTKHNLLKFSLRAIKIPTEQRSLSLNFY